MSFLLIRTLFLTAAAAGIMLAQAPAPGRVMGVISAKQGSGATVKTDAGEVFSVVFAPDTKFHRIAPGETNLKNAQVIAASDLSSGDRVLARGTATDAKTVVAQSVILISATDIAEKQKKERQDWQTRGISGTVTAVDAGKKEITVRPPALGAQQTVVLKLKDNAPLRRYAPDSVRFADAQPATVKDVKVGDQLRARGDKSADGASFDADEIVVGSFRTLAGTVLAVDEAAKQVTMKDLDSGKTITVKMTADSTLKRFPSFAGGPGGPGGQGAPGGGDRPAGAPAAGGLGGPRPGGSDRPAGPGPGGPGGPGGGMTGGGMMGGRMPDMQQMLERLPAAALADIKPGETMIVSSTAGASSEVMTAITVLGNAERLITMRRAMAARAGAAGGAGGGATANWNLDGMSMIPMP